jgi:hypothetical protein
MRRLIRGLGVFAVLGLAGCGGVVDEDAEWLKAQEAGLRQCPQSGQCAPGEVCYYGPGGACYPCKLYPQYCAVN